MDDDREIIDQFVTEVKEHLDALEDDFIRLEKQKDSPDRKLVDKIFRAVHSIKGAAGFLGLTKIGTLSHVMETLLSMMRAGEILPESEIVDALLSGVDLLNAMSDDVDHSNETDISRVHDRLASMLARELSPKVKGELNTPVKLSDFGGGEIGFDINEFTLKNMPPNMSLYVLKYDLSELDREHKTPMELIKELLTTGEIIDARIYISSNDLHEGLPKEPLLYEVLYATILLPDDIHEMTGLSDERIIHVKKDGLGENIPSSSGFRIPASEFRKAGETHFISDPTSHTESETRLIPDAGVRAKNFLPLPAPEEQTEALKSPLPSETLPALRSPESLPLPETEAGTEECHEPDVSDESPADLSNTVRIHVDILDKLMMLAGELVLVRNQQLISAETADAAARSVVQRLDIVTTELQETIMRARMQPIGKIFRKFPRIVRELGKKHGKEIRIAIVGSAVELDKSILEALADPLSHLIRNCCDHGIEPPGERLLAGKSEHGLISLSAYHEAGHINIEIRDDGRGINPDAVRRKIIENRLKNSSELERMSDEEILNFILLPGFSTAEKVSDLSGRGVGMDVVKTGIEKLGGTLDIESALGKGTAIHLRLPLTLAIIPCLIISLGEQRYAIPQINLVELVCLYDDDVRTKIETADFQEFYRLRNRLLHLVRLSEILARSLPFTREVRAGITEKYRNAYSAATDMQLNFAVLKVGPLRFGLIMDRVLGTEEVVVKPMHSAVKSLKIYSGATVMGDGKVALILDAEGIAGHAGITAMAPVTEEWAEEADTQDDIQTLLLFRYGEKEQFALSLPLIRRIERIKTSAIEEVGEKEFITVSGISVRVIRPDQVLKVSPGVGQDEMFLILPKYIRKPVGLLASALVDIEESAVDLNVDSYMEDGLLGTAVIRDHITLFPDICRLAEKIEPEWSARRVRSDACEPFLQSKQVLLAEDASFFRQLVKGYLESEGYKVITAENGRAALDRFNENRFDLIVSDIEMPVMNGWDFIRTVRKGSNIPAVALTALDSEKDRKTAKDCGYDRYEVKIDREHFLTTVAGLLKVRSEK